MPQVDSQEQRNSSAFDINSRQRKTFPKSPSRIFRRGEERKRGYPEIGHVSPSRCGESELLIDRPAHLATALEMGKASASHEGSTVGEEPVLPGRRTPLLGLCYEGPCDGSSGGFRLFRAMTIPITKHVKIRGLANAFDPAWIMYFARRQSAKRSVPHHGAEEWLESDAG
jgi:hypothetical protein